MAVSKALGFSHPPNDCDIAEVEDANVALVGTVAGEHLPGSEWFSAHLDAVAQRLLRREKRIGNPAWLHEGLRDNILELHEGRSGEVVFLDPHARAHGEGFPIGLERDQLCPTVPISLLVSEPRGYDKCLGPYSSWEMVHGDSRLEHTDAMGQWFARLLGTEPGYEKDLVDRYTRELVMLARRQLPETLRRRVDPEDIVQSVYRSFFRRLNDGQFEFEESHDVWRLLATITYCKARNAVKHHHRSRRDVRRERPLLMAEDSTAPGVQAVATAPGPADLALLYDCLEQFLAALPEHCRQIVLRRLEGNSIEEIARQVHRSQRTVLRVLASVPELAAQQLDTVP